MARLVVLASMLWPSLYSLLGLSFGAAICACGGRMRREGRTLEFTWRASALRFGPRVRRFPFRAITLGHVILAFSQDELAGLRAHEHVHVRQYERWGPLFAPAYFASSAWQWLRGRDPYWDNPFEKQARARAR